MGLLRRSVTSPPATPPRTWLMKCGRRCSPSVRRSSPRSSCTRRTRIVASSWASCRSRPSSRKWTLVPSRSASQDGRGKLPTVVVAIGGRSIHSPLTWLSQGGVEILVLDKPLQVGAHRDEAILDPEVLLAVHVREIEAALRFGLRGDHLGDDLGC